MSGAVSPAGRHPDFFEASPIGCAILGRDRRIAALNAAARAMLGLRAASAVGCSIEEILAGELASACDEVSTGRAPSCHHRLTSRSDQDVPAELEVYLYALGVLDGPPHPIGLMINDIGPQRRAERAARAALQAESRARERAEQAQLAVLERFQDLRTLEQRRARKAALLRTITDLNPDIIFSIGLSDEVLLLNAAAAEWCGVALDAAAGLSAEELIPGWSAGELPSRGREVVAAGARGAFRWSGDTADGSAAFDVTVEPLVVDSAVTGTIWFLRTIEEEAVRTRVEELTIQLVEAQRIAEHARRTLDEETERMRQADAWKDEVLALISHDLRTPLTSVVGYADLLGAEADELDPRHSRFVEIIARNGRRVVSLVDDILLVARHQAGTLAVTLRPLEVGTLVVDCVESITPAADEKGVSVLSAVSAPVHVRGDATRLSQVVDNLLSNAVKYTPVGGVVRVELGVEQGDAVLRVHDTGPGIRVEQQASIFGRFTRTPESSRSTVPGAGLGLTIAKAITEAHGGRISVESLPGTGSVFCVRLPVISSEPDEDRPAVQIV